MPIKKLKKPIYINVKIEDVVMAEALKQAKIKTGILKNTVLVRHLIWSKAHKG